MEEDDEEVLSVSETSDDFTCEESEPEFEDGDDSLCSRSDTDESCKQNNAVLTPVCQQKSQNVDALLRGNLVVKRQSLLPRVLSVTEREAVLKKPFKLPCADGYSNQNEQLIRRLCARKRFVPWRSNRPALIPITNRLNHVSVEVEVQEEITKLPPDIEPLILWQPENPEDGDCNLIPIEVDHILVKFLRGSVLIRGKEYSSCLNVLQVYAPLISMDAFWLMTWDWGRLCSQLHCYIHFFVLDLMENHWLKRQ